MIVREQRSATQWLLDKHDVLYLRLRGFSTLPLMTSFSTCRGVYVADIIKTSCNLGIV